MKKLVIRSLLMGLSIAALVITFSLLYPRFGDWGRTIVVGVLCFLIFPLSVSFAPPKGRKEIVYMFLISICTVLAVILPLRTVLPRAEDPGATSMIMQGVASSVGFGVGYIVSLQIFFRKLRKR